MAQNPLLSREYRIPFHEIRPEHVVPAFRAVLSEARAEVEAVLSDPTPPTYASLLERLDVAKERVGRVVRVAKHLTAAQDSEALRVAFAEVQPEFTAFYAELESDPRFFSRLFTLAESEEGGGLDPLRRRHLERTLREIRRSGGALPAEERSRVVDLFVGLGQLAKRYGENVLDETNAFVLDLTDPAELEGLPESAVEGAKKRAEEAGVEGWRFTLDADSYIAFMAYSEWRDLRRRMYEAMSYRALRPPHDNRPLITEILGLRRELAIRLGYRDYADYVLEERMVGSGERAAAFVADLEERTRRQFQRESAELERFAQEELQIQDLEPWDVAFVAERMQRARFALDPEELRPYFSLDGVLEGMFTLTREVFGIRVEERRVEEVWHPEVRYFEIFDETGVQRGAFYADFFPRREKRQGAWMEDLITGGPDAVTGEFRPHLGVILCNFTPPTRERPSLLTHDEVQTLFHEFGHLLHHCISTVEVPSLAGVNVVWDFVELPSQLLENWTWERESLALLARHYESGEALPEALLERMLAARRFRGASFQMRQLSLATVDLWLHREFDPYAGENPLVLVRPVLERFALRPEWARPEFVAAFSHIFASDYAAGYYSYKWSEVLDADAFGRFQAEGILNPAVGRAFREAVLERGNSEDAAVLFRRFRGREPDSTALLRRTLEEFEVDV